MAKTHHLKHSSNFGFPPSDDGDLGRPIEDLKKHFWAILFLNRVFKLKGLKKDSLNLKLKNE